MKKKITTGVLKSMACAYFITPAAASNTLGVSAPPFGHANKYPQFHVDDCIKKGGEVIGLANKSAYCVFTDKDFHSAVADCEKRATREDRANACAVVTTQGTRAPSGRTETPAATPNKMKRR